MNKFDSKEFERMQIEKLKKEQLIKSIENRKELELKALIKATKENKNKSQEEILKIKNQIIQEELNKENQQNENEMRRKIEHIRKVEKRLEQLKQRKEIEEQRRKTDSERIVKGIVKKVYEQNDNIDLQKNQEDGKKEQKDNEEYEENKQVLINFLNENSTLESKRQRREQARQEKVQNTFTKMKEKISDFRLVKAINAYKKNMNNYFGKNKVGSKFDETIGEMNPNKIKKETRANFAQTLYGVVNHKKAQEAAQKNTKQVYRARTH